VTDRHQRGILRGFSQPLFCTVPGVQDRPVPRSLTVHYYDGNYAAIIWINRDAHRNKPQSFLGRHKRNSGQFGVFAVIDRSSSSSPVMFKYAINL